MSVLPVIATAPTMLTEHQITVLLVDDQAIIGEALRRMLAPEKDIVFHFCSDPTKAVETGNRINPTVILQDLVMPQIDGLSLVKLFRANPKTSQTPMIVLSTKEEPKIKAEAFSLGANDYLVKLPDRIELIARIRYHSKGYINLLQRDEAYRKLSASQAQMKADVEQASHYVQSLLPKPTTAGAKVRADWRFVPCDALGGDTFGYHWIDDRYFAIFLLDVCGHGVGAALLSVSAMNVLRSQSLPNTDFRKPDEVLNALNEAFRMEDHNDMYFTMWYGVYDAQLRKLHYSGGGHPPALLFKPGSGGPLNLPVELESQGPMVGAIDGMTYPAQTVDVPHGGRLIVYSDGVFELQMPSGDMWHYPEYVNFMAQPPTPNVSEMDRLMLHARSLRGGVETFEDDFSIVEIDFD